jgi:AAA family ATP:ADP antiporter
MKFHAIIPGTPEERPAVAYSFACFFLLFTSWYTIRPIREAMGIQRDAGDLPLLMAGTVLLGILINPLIAKLTTKFSREAMARRVYRFLALNIALFYVALVLLPTWIDVPEDLSVKIGYGLYIWVSAFNVLIGSLLWSLLAELFPAERSKQLFGFAAAGCSLGGMVGGAIVLLAQGQLKEHDLDPLHLLLVAALLLEVAARIVGRIVKHAPTYSGNDEFGEAAVSKPLQGGAWSGLQQVKSSPYLLGISGYVLFYSLTGTFAYLIQGNIIAALDGDTAERIKKFAYIDLITNSASILLQIFAVRSVVTRFGVGMTLAVLPVLTAVSFTLLWAWPVYFMVVVTQALRRAANYGLTRPAREMLYTPLPREEKYMAKNLIDVGVYRSGDAVTSLLFKGLSMAGVGMSGFAAITVGSSFLWVGVALFLGKGFVDRVRAQE